MYLCMYVRTGMYVPPERASASTRTEVVVPKGEAARGPAIQCRVKTGSGTGDRWFDVGSPRGCTLGRKREYKTGGCRLQTNRRLRTREEGAVVCFKGDVRKILVLQLFLMEIEDPARRVGCK